MQHQLPAVNVESQFFDGAKTISKVPLGFDLLLAICIDMQETVLIILGSTSFK